MPLAQILHQTGIRVVTEKNQDAMYALSLKVNYNFKIIQQSGKDYRLLRQAA